MRNATFDLASILNRNEGREQIVIYGGAAAPSNRRFVTANSYIANETRFLLSDFGFVSDFEIRISDLNGRLSMAYQNIQVPAGNKITTSGGRLKVPDQPIIPFIEGDGTG